MYFHFGITLVMENMIRYFFNLLIVISKKNNNKISNWKTFVNTF